MSSPFWLMVCSAVGLFLLANVLVFALPSYRRWLKRIEEDERQSRAWAKEHYAAAQELIAWNAAQLRRLEKPRCRVYPPVHRVHP